ncbi:hypothetical protein Tco_0910365 [Tanacetum coccineum]|uniref:GAG-pre-integrase domain-containing protein n=1 Tax=Tanacetum coccineum TaxID=301880 RepID=A0ABQ5CSN7_9ASTR
MLSSHQALLAQQSLTSQQDQHLDAAQQAQHARSIGPKSSTGILGLASTQETLFPNAFSAMTIKDLTWNMDTGDIYPVTMPSPIPSALLSLSPTTWHQRLGHPGAKLMGIQLLQLKLRLGKTPSRSFRPVKSAEILWQFWTSYSLRVSLAQDGS